MNPRNRVFQALRQHADEAGQVQGTIGEIKEWIGPDGSSWPIQELLFALRDEGRFRGRPYFDGGGCDDGRFGVNLI